MLEIRGIWLCHMSRWVRYVLRPRVRAETPESETVPHIGPYTPCGNNTSPRLMFLSLKLVIRGHEPTIEHNVPSWGYYLLLGQSNKQQRRTCKNYLRKKI